MSPPNVEIPKSAAPTLGQTLRRIQFVRSVPAGSTVLRRYESPESAAAIESTSDAAAFDPPTTWPEPTDRFDLLILPEEDSRAAQQQVARWLAPPSHPYAPRKTTIRLKEAVVHWRPGRAILQASKSLIDEMLPALIDFAFYEAELRRMELELEPAEQLARTDVGLAYDVRHADRSQWPRLKKTIQSLYTMRLQFAQLEPRLNIAPPSFAQDTRKLYTRLGASAQLEARLAAFSDRLEACEDLYEGAIDRVSDFRWYRKGNLLEIAIVGLLIGETLLLLADLFVRMLEHQSR